MSELYSKLESQVGDGGGGESDMLYNMSIKSRQFDNANKSKQQTFNQSQSSQVGSRRPYTASP